MNGIQKVIKIFAICLAVVIIANILGAIIFGLSLVTHIGVSDNKNNEGTEKFVETYSNIQKIEIDSISSNIVIKSGEEFKVEAEGIKNKFSSKQSNNTLKIEESKVWFATNNASGTITVYIPGNSNLRELELDAGAGKIEIENITLNKLDLDQGAGVLEISNAQINNAKIDGGAGEMKATSSRLNNLDLDAGIGKIDLEAEITGNSQIDCGIGEMNLSLIGSEEEYRITAEKGIGNIKINNEEQAANTVYGKGNNNIRLEGGIGNITVEFEAWELNNGSING